jgi:uncharacterized protein
MTGLAQSTRAMLLNLRTLRESQEDLELRYQASLFGPDPGTFVVVSPVRLSFRISKHDERRYHLVGHVAGTLEVECSRCVEPLPLEVDAAFDLEYLPRTENVGDGEVEIEEDDLSTAFYEEETIDLGQLMLEQFHLALPMKPLCSETCRGLCPQCGTNLNVASCSCRRTWEGSGLVGLKSLVGEDHGT